jgi:ferredoxin
MNDPSENAPPWGLFAPIRAGTSLGLGWKVEGLSPIRRGAATLELRHERGAAQVVVHRNGGSPRGVAHTSDLDFLLMNGGGPTEGEVGRVLLGLAAALQRRGRRPGDEALLAGLAPHDPARTGGAPPRVARPSSIDVEALLDELAAAAPEQVGLGLVRRRGTGHEDLRVLNIVGAGACDSDCLFCVEKWNPGHRARPKVDVTRDLVLAGAGQYDMLFFATGEPTIHPQLFDLVELARSVGFTRFGMSSHFRTFADPRFALRTLRAGFEFFDISLHAADDEGQRAVNPIGDEGRSLGEALKGLGVLGRLAEALDLPLSITHKIVVSRLNVTQIEEIFRATYDRGVRHYIIQPVRTHGLDPERAGQLAISEDEILPHLDDFIRRTESTEAVIKPYGFPRQRLRAARHVETEQNRVKNVFGRTRAAPTGRKLPVVREERPSEGRHQIEVKVWGEDAVRFAADGARPLLDEGLARGLGLPFGCRMGSCGMCSARLVAGRVDQGEQIFLSQDQIERGIILMCQAKPLSDVTVEMCSDEEIDAL